MKYNEENYIKTYKKNRIYVVIEDVIKVLLLLLFIPFTIFAIRLFTNTGDGTFYIIQVCFWTLYIIRLILGRYNEIIKTKLRKIKNDRYKN